MVTTTLINQNKINARVDLAMRASGLSVGSDLRCAADSGVVLAAPTQPCVSTDPRPVMIPAPKRQDRIEASATGHQPAGPTTHQMPARGKAATKFNTRLGRRTCSPPV